MRQRIVALLIAAMLAAAAWSLPDLRRSLIAAIVTYDAEPSAPPTLPGLNDAGTPRFELRRFLDSETCSAIRFEAEMAGFLDLLRTALGR